MREPENAEHADGRPRVSPAPESHQFLSSSGDGKWPRRLRAIAAAVMFVALVSIAIWAGRDPGAKPPAIAERDPERLDSSDPLQAEAAQLAHRLRRDFPDDVAAIFIRGLILNKFVSCDAAARCWQTCIQRQPDFGEAHYWLGKEWFKKGDYEKALEHFRKAVDLKVPMADARLQLADAQINAGRPGEAVDVLEEQVRTVPQNVAGWFCLGHAYTLLGKLAEAEAAYRRAVELNPRCHQAWHGLTMISQERGDTDKARQYLQEFKKWQALAFAGHQAAKRTENDGDTLERTLATAYTDAGRLYAGRGDPRTGEACWIRAGEIDSAHLESRIRLLELYGQQRRPQAALPVLEQLSRIQPENPNHSKNLDALRRMLGQDEK
jgi:tetratricopeptide (TPR) repeat protein